MLDLFDIDMHFQSVMLTSYTVRSNLTKFPNPGDFDIDENLVHSVN